MRVKAGIQSLKERVAVLELENANLCTALPENDRQKHLATLLWRQAHWLPLETSKLLGLMPDSNGTAVLQDTVLRLRRLWYERAAVPEKAAATKTKPETEAALVRVSTCRPAPSPSSSWFVRKLSARARHEACMEYVHALAARLKELEAEKAFLQQLTSETKGEGSKSWGIFAKAAVLGITTAAGDYILEMTSEFASRLSFRE
jgi:hypothetical protein